MIKENVKYGWIGLYRSMTNHWIYPTSIFTKYEAWIDLLLMVNYEEKKVFDGADMQSCKKGETITSQLKLMKKWGWSKSKLLKFLKVLKNDQMIDYKADTKKTTIKVLNFHSYQDFEAADKLKKDHRKTVERLEKDHRKTIEELTKRLQKDTNNKDNNTNKVNKLIIEPQKIKTFSEDVLKCYNECLKYFNENLHPLGEKKINNWLDTIEKLNRIEKVPFNLISEITKKVRNDSFWSSNFSSITKLRKKNKDDVMYITYFYNKFNNQNSPNQEETATSNLLNAIKKNQ